ncbi:MAG: DnaD domain protein [Firmicutes bacterium]|nr:DnaD domain protein [Bacillota bacterium]
MKFRCRQTKDYYLLDTGIENVFISEYMANAPGDYIKVYLYGRMYAELGEGISPGVMANQLNMKEMEVQKAWTYWEHVGAVRKVKDPDGETVEFVNLKELIYKKEEKSEVQAKPSAPAQNKVILSDKSIQNMYKSIERILGRIMNGTEMMEILSWINDYHAAPEIVVYAFSHCKDKGKESLRYVAAVVKRWVDEGLEDVIAVEEFLERIDQRYLLYKRVYKALGFARNATEEEMKIMNRWFDDMGYDIDRVLQACRKTSGISNPNINYVNKILENWYEEATGTHVGAGEAPKPASAADVQRYYAFLRNRAEEEAEARIREVYDTIPEIRSIEENMNACTMKISKVYLSGSENKELEVKELQKSINELNQEKAILLTDHDFELDYMDVQYKCDMCKDTGTNDEGGRCECYALRAKEAETWQRNLSSI